ncbi:glycosyl hydrolase family 28-related protein [Paenibacillus daejeonensis]|uniref:glycosyl hydrolase family 28-related protein n=1 Tax=Paenibacillus daejeonensis TaxID=135193 RepID=UPI00146ED428|nr:glycosyl hydrolase family 28-related protein [Paenibacillus daejeonensis]
MLRKSGLLLLIVSLAAGLLPGLVGMALAEEAPYVNTDSTTSGNWVGAYGSDGYILPYFTSNRSDGRDDPPAADVALLPSYVDSYSKSGNVNYWQSNPAGPSALQLPDASGRKRIEVYTGGNFTYSFVLNDTQQHLFSVYTTDFGVGSADKARFEILNSSNQVLQSREVDNVGSGKYLCFAVQGSFKLKVTRVSGTRAFAQGFFFDAPVPLTAQDLTVVPLPARSVELQWTDSTSGPVAVLRRLQGETDFVKIAETAGGIDSYIDENLIPGQHYEYALQSKSGALYSLPSAPVSYLAESYDSTSLTFLQSPYSVEAPGQPVALTAVLTDEDDEPIEGYTITFELQGDYVGTYIDSEIGQGVTDANGVASVNYTPPYAGQFNVRAWTEPNDDDLLDGAEAITALDVQQPQWELPPLLMRVTDAVKPGMLFQLSGHAMQADDWDDVKAVIEPLSTSGMTPSSAAVELDIIQRDELRGQFLQLAFPDSSSPGAYRLWVSNEEGWSEPIDLNKPRPLFMSEYEVYEGLSIDVSGRNFQAREFDATAETKVRLTQGTSAYAVPITELTPYSVRFLVEDVPLGEYEVEVSNDSGQTWITLQSEQTLTVVAPGQDPLGLGVAWADHFDWDNVFDVTDYGAIADDDLDDTAAIQATIAAAKSDGGGVVYLPPGTFHATLVQLPSGIVLMGDGPDSTFLYHTGSSQNFIQASGDGKTVGRTGVARIAIRAADDTMYPDAFIWLGQDWGAAVEDVTLRTASELFVVETSIEYPVLVPVDRSQGGGRGQGVLFVGDERIVIKDNRMVGWVAQYNRTYMNRYVQSTGNYVEYGFSQMPITADYTFIWDNEFVMRGEMDVEVHGISIKSNSHVENNIVRTTGADLKTTYNNDGESIMAEMPGAYFSVGEVLGATADTITLAPTQPLPEPIRLRRGTLSVVIVDGTGLGQYREVQYTSGTTYALTEDWDVIPDRTSKFSLIAPNDNVTVYRNELTDNQRGVWLYGNAIDAVVADNTLTNTDGIYISSTAAVPTGRYTPAYFVNVKGNQLIGTPGTGHAAGIIAVSNRRNVGGLFYATGVYGVEIRDNYLYGSQEPISTPRHQKFSGIVSSAATLSSDGNPIFTLEDRDNLNVIIENNQLEHMADGLVMMSGLYGHTTRGNQFTDVLRELYERFGPGTSRLLQLPGAFADQRAPYWPTRSALQTELGTSVQAELSWNPAEDIIGVTQYRIYQNGVLLDTVSGGITTYETAPLPAGNTYHFQVTALDAAGNESYSALGATIITPSGP